VRGRGPGKDAHSYRRTLLHEPQSQQPPGRGGPLGLDHVRRRRCCVSATEPPPHPLPPPPGLPTSPPPHLPTSSRPLATAPWSAAGQKPVAQSHPAVAGMRHPLRYRTTSTLLCCLPCRSSIDSFTSAPGFTTSTYANDTCIVTLRSPGIPDEVLSPATLNDNPAWELGGSDVVVAGWGYVSEDIRVRVLPPSGHSRTLSQARTHTHTHTHTHAHARTQCIAQAHLLNCARCISHRAAQRVLWATVLRRTACMCAT
jgi:hypothetical protein